MATSETTSGEMTAKEILIKAKSLLEEKGWCQGAYAKNAEGAVVYANDDAASCYCAMGACYAAMATIPGARQQAEHLNLALNRLDYYCIGPITFFNDQPGRTKAEVLSLFDAAIASLP